MEIKRYTDEAVELLARLISTPSVSRDEGAAADIFADFIGKCELPCQRIGNNILIQEELDPAKPTLLLNAHIDTVKPAGGYTRDPFTPSVEDGKLYGLGSNDDGGSLVALLETYSLLSAAPQPYRLVFSPFFFMMIEIIVRSVMNVVRWIKTDTSELETKEGEAV